MGQSGSTFSFGPGSSSGFGSDYGGEFRSNYSGGFGSGSASFGTDDNFTFNFGGAGTGPDFFSGCRSYGPPREFGFDTNRFSFQNDARDRTRQGIFTEIDKLPLKMHMEMLASATDKTTSDPFSGMSSLSPQPMRFGFGLVDKCFNIDDNTKSITVGANANLQGSKPGISFRLGQPFELDLFNDVRLGDTQFQISNDWQSFGLGLNLNVGGKEGNIFVSDTFLVPKINEWLPTNLLKNVRLDSKVNWAYTPSFNSEFEIEELEHHRTVQALDLAITVGVAKKWTSESKTSVTFTHQNSTKWKEWNTPDFQVSGKFEQSNNEMSCKHEQRINQYLNLEARAAKQIHGTSPDGTRWSLTVKPRC